MTSDFIRDVFQWDVLNWGRALPFWTKRLKAEQGDKALSLGERDGGLTLWLAKQGLKVTCTDLNGVTQRAKELHKHYRISEQVEYQGADITRLPYPDESFTIVAFKSVLGAIKAEYQQQALNEILRVLKPGGQLIFIENLSGSAIHRFFRKNFTNWAAYWKYPKFEELKQYCAPFQKLEYESFGFLGVFGRNEFQRRILGFLDKVLCPLLPRSTHYLAFGVATKKK